MKKQIIPILLAVILFIFVGGGVWYLLRVSEGDKKTGSDVNQDTSSTILGENSGNIQELPKPPEGYSQLKDSNLIMREEQKKNLRERFAEILLLLEKDPRSGSLWADLGYIKYAFNDYEGAEALWLYTLKINPNISVAVASLAQLYWHKIPNYPKAEEMFKKFIKDSPSPAAYVDLSDLYRYSYMEKTNLADDVLLDGYRTYPNEYGFLLALARYYQEKGGKTKAIEYYEKYLAKNPTDASAREELERLQK